MSKMVTMTIRFPIPTMNTTECLADPRIRDEKAEEWDRMSSSDAQIADIICYALESQSEVLWYQSIEVLSIASSDDRKPFDTAHGYQRGKRKSKRPKHLRA